MRESGPKEQLQVARSGTASAAELSQLAESPWFFVREAVANHPRTPQADLERMLPTGAPSSDGWRMLRALLSNPSSPVGLLSRAAQQVLDECEGVEPRDGEAMEALLALSTCSRAPADRLLELGDPERVPRHIRRRIAAPGCAVPLLERLAEDPSQQVAQRARKALARTEDSGGASDPE